MYGQNRPLRTLALYLMVPVQLPDSFPSPCETDSVLNLTANHCTSESTHCEPIYSHDHGCVQPKRVEYLLRKPLIRNPPTNVRVRQSLYRIEGERLRATIYEMENSNSIPQYTHTDRFRRVRIQPTNCTTTQSPIQYGECLERKRNSPLPFSRPKTSLISALPDPLLVLPATTSRLPRPHTGKERSTQDCPTLECIPDRMRQGRGRARQDTTGRTGLLQISRIVTVCSVDMYRMRFSLGFSPAN
jgi:hypothetical protein